MHVSNMLGTAEPGRRDRRAARTRSARWSWSTRSQAVPQLPVDVAALGVDFLAFTGHKMLRPDRHRRAVGTARAAGRAAAVPRRRRDDRDGDDGPARRTPPLPHKFEAGTPPIAEAVGARRGRRLPDRHRHGRDRRARAGDHGVRAGARCAEVPGCGSSARPTPVDRGGAISLRARRRPPARRRRRSSTRDGVAVRAGHHCARPICDRFGVPAIDPGVVLPVHDAGRDRRAGPRAASRRRRFFGVMQLDSLYQEIILDHYQHPHARGPARAVRRRGAPRQPDLRRRDDAAGQARRRRAVGRRLVRRRRAARSARPAPRC